MATLSELLSRLHIYSHIRGRQFERICKWYLQNAPQYRLLLDKVWLWNEWPNRWGPDAGIDLVAQTYHKKLWAIQAKAYAPAHHITKADVDTFLSESSREVFVYRLLIGTTNYIGHTAERTLDAQEKPVGKVLLSDLRKTEVVWPESPESLEVEKAEQKRPRPHQRRAISDVCEGFRKNDRGQLIMASGTGKTLVNLWIAERLRIQRTLVILPSLSLLAQTLREWTSNASEPFHYIPVCSDDTVRGADRLVSKTSDLGLPAATDPSEIAEFLSQDGPLVVFSTYQSSPVIAEVFKKHNVPAFDLAIADEAHRCAGAVSSPFATILDADGILSLKRLFMTATPRYFTDRVREEAKEVEYEIASMDDKSKFGQVFHKLSYSEAIQKNLLSDYRVVIIGVDDPTYREYAEQGTFVTTDGEHITEARILASQIAVAKAMREYGLRRIISFHSRIERAREFSQRFPDVVNWMPEKARPEGQIWSKHVSGQMPAGQRDVLLDRFRELESNERGVLSNARCLGEGVDVPSLDGIAFIDPRSSQLDIIQAVGRAIRKSPEKTIGTVVLPVFIDPEQDPEAALRASDFRPVWNVLKALRAHDEVLGEVLDKLRRQLGRDPSAEIDIPEKIMMDLPVTVDESFVYALRLKTIERSTASWEFWYGLLERDIEYYGHTAMIPPSYVTYDGYKLGAWVASQRKAYKQGDLSHERQRLLGKLLTWEWDFREAQWDLWFEHLKAYVSREGHAAVPASYVTEGGRNLGAWAFTQRIAYRKDKLSPVRRRLLEGLPGWTWAPKSNGKIVEWSDGLESLRKYAAENGEADIYYEYITKDGFSLGKWVARQRKRYNNGKMPTKQQVMLESIPGWIWDISKARKAQKWSFGLKSLREYVEQNHHANINHRHVTESGFPLGKWVGEQHKRYFDGNISYEHMQVLESIPDWRWDRSGLSWKRGIYLLREYALREKHTDIPKSYLPTAKSRLGVWVSTQRSAFRNGTMSVEKQREIEKVPYWVWDPDWGKGIQSLRVHILKIGYTYVTDGYVTTNGFALGKWVQLQRKYWIKGTLLLSERKQLEQFPGWTQTCLEAAKKPPSWFKGNPETWAVGFRLLRRYSKREGHTFVPKSYLTHDGYLLGEWVAEQRDKQSKSKLSSKQRRLLEKLPGWVWDVSQATWIVEDRSSAECFTNLHDYIHIDRNGKLAFVYDDDWARRCRLKYRAGRLSAKAVWLLENTRGWTWDLVPSARERSQSQKPHVTATSQKRRQ